MKKALILDLDNTIYPVSSIGDQLFEPLLAMIDQDAGNLTVETLLEAKDELTRRPFQLVADKFKFSDELKSKGINLLNNITYNLPMYPFDEYHHIKSIPQKKFLMTTGFSKLQWSKVRMLDIEDDFEEIHIVDPEISRLTKKDVFADIILRYGYSIDEVLVIGDDPLSEIKAASELGIDTFLFDPNSKHNEAVTTYKSSNLKEVLNIIS